MFYCFRNGVVLVVACLTLQGCFSSEKETKSVQWYIENEAERHAQLKECFENLSEMEGAPNCVNAQRAANKITAGEMPTFGD